MPKRALRPSSRSASRPGRIGEEDCVGGSRPFPSGAGAHIFDPKAAPVNHDSYDDRYIRGILNTVKTIAMVGVSANSSRPSYFAFKYLLERGYRMIPINPGLAGQELLGRRVYAKLAEANGLKVVMNRCPKIEYGRLSSEIAWMGVNTRTLTAKKPRLFGRGIQRMALDRVTLAGGATDASTRAEKADEGTR